MRTEQEIRERIEEIEETNRRDGWILGRELVRENQRVIDTLKWVLDAYHCLERKERR